MKFFKVQKRAKNQKNQNFEKNDCGIKYLPPKQTCMQNLVRIYQ